MIPCDGTVFLLVCVIIDVSTTSRFCLHHNWILYLTSVKLCFAKNVVNGCIYVNYIAIAAWHLINETFPHTVVNLQTFLFFLPLRNTFVTRISTKYSNGIVRNHHMFSDDLTEVLLGNRSRVDRLIVACLTSVARGLTVVVMLQAACLTWTAWHLASTRRCWRIVSATCTSTARDPLTSSRTLSGCQCLALLDVNCPRRGTLTPLSDVAVQLLQCIFGLCRTNKLIHCIYLWIVLVSLGFGNSVVDSSFLNKMYYFVSFITFINRNVTN